MSNEIIDWRTQNDGLNDYYSNMYATHFDWDDHLTNQAAAPETEIDFMIRNHSRRMDATPQYTEFDYSIDLQQAIHMGNTLRDAQITAPEELRAKYPDKYAILQGIDTGEYARDLQQLEREQRLEKQLDEIRKTAGAVTPTPPLTQPGNPRRDPEIVT